MATVMTRIEESTGGVTGELTLEFLTERITVRELIRSRVYQEVSEHNAALSGLLCRPEQPTAIERTLNGDRTRERTAIDWEARCALALDAFLRNGFLVIVDDRQVAELDEEIVLCHGSRVSFLKLVPLVGG